MIKLKIKSLLLSIISILLLSGSLSAAVTTLTTPTPGNHYGNSVAINGDEAVVGAIYDSEAQVRAGAV